MKTRLLILLFLITRFSISFAQTNVNVSSLSEIRAGLDNMFSTLDKTKVPTGYLLDYAIDLVDFGNYSGQLVDSNYVDNACYADMLYSINSAKITGDSLAIHSTVNSLFEGTTQSYLKASIALFEYNYIVENALSDGLITFINDKVADVYENGQWRNPYGSNYILGFTTSASGFVWNTLNISFPSSLFLHNLNATSIEFDAGDGWGYRTVQLGSSYNISYSESGRKDLNLKVTLGGGSVLYAHTYVYSINPPESPTGTSSLADTFFTVSTTYNGDTLSASVACKYASGRLERPFIVAEGFDPYDFFSASTDPSEHGFTNLCSFYDKASSYIKTYDIVYIDWRNYKADIRANAKLLQEIIVAINNQKHLNGSSFRNVVFGESMGGLIATYALRSMEQSGVQHETDYFISNDTPYRGANLPLGLQYVIRDVLRKVTSLPKLVTKKFDFDIPGFQDLFNATSVKQLLYRYVNDNLTLTDGHSALELEMMTMGMPQGDAGHPLESIALVSGGNFNINGILSPSLFTSSSTPILSGKFICRCSTGLDILISVLSCILQGNPLGSGHRNITYDVDAYPYLANGQVLMTSNVYYEKSFLWTMKMWILMSSTTKYAPTSGLTYDSLRGSYYDLELIVDEIDLNALEQENKWYTSSVDFNYVKKIMLIPTASALRATNHQYDYYSQLQATAAQTPFQSFALADSSRFHTDLSLNQKNFLDNILSLNISGPSTLEPGDTTYQYTYSAGYSDIISLTWSTSNSNVATINSSTGVLTPVGTGGVDVILSGSGNGKYYYKKKHVVIGFPKVRITKSAWGNTTILNAQCVSADDAPFLQQGVSNGSILFQWGIKYDYGSITWNTPTNSSSFSIQLTNATSITTVFLRLVDGNNQSNTGAVVHKTIQRPDPLVANISQLGRTTTGENVTYLAFSVPDMYDENQNMYLVLKEDIPGVLDYGLSYYKVGTRTGKVYRDHEDTILGYKYHFFDFRSQSVVNLELNSLYQNLHNVGDVETLIIKAYDEEGQVQIIPIPVKLFGVH